MRETAVGAGIYVSLYRGRQNTAVISTFFFENYEVSMRLYLTISLSSDLGEEDAT